MNTQNIETNANTSKCDCETQTINVFLTCSGAANCGQIANQAAVRLDEEGIGKMYCLAGIGSHNPGMIESIKSADRVVILDGCPTACARKTAEHAGITVTEWICVTQNGIKKVHNFNVKPEEIEIIVEHTKQTLSKRDGLN
jgi:uncharacterized metal-binding protein